MPHADLDKSIKLYGQLMQEIRLRFRVIDKLALDKTALPAPIARESAFLQLRMICELVALGCLVAHGDIKGKTEILKSYSADLIIKQLESMNQDFYPVPFVIDKNHGGKHLSQSPLDGITKAELLSLYGKCGDQLHKGSLKKLLKNGDLPITADFSDIIKWTNKINNLLVQHRILLFDKRCWICIFYAAPTYKVSVLFGEPF